MKHFRRPALSALFFAAFAFAPGTVAAAIDPVDVSPHLTRMARLTMLEWPRAGADSVVAVVVNYRGQSLRGESNELWALEPGEGSLGAFIETLIEPYRYTLFRVSDGSGEVRGFVFASDITGADFTLFEEENLILIEVDHTINDSGSGDGDS